MSIECHGSEKWALRETEEVRLDTFDIKVLRRIYGSYIDPQTKECRNSVQSIQFISWK